MNKDNYEKIENYMLSCMTDSAHDREHIYRVLYIALDIAGHELQVDYDVLICACLLHDIGRQEQFADPRLCHAAVGAKKAATFLQECGYGQDFIIHVSECIKSHRFRSGSGPRSIEAKILFDADKVDVTGAIGIARTLLHQGHEAEPLYLILPDGQVSDGTLDTEESFFREYTHKLEGLYTRFHTKRAAAIAADRQETATTFYQNMLKEVRSSYQQGSELLSNQLIN